jgi:hypothetical protein
MIMMLPLSHHLNYYLFYNILIVGVIRYLLLYYDIILLSYHIILLLYYILQHTYCWCYTVFIIYYDIILL